MDARQLLTNPMDYPIEIRMSSKADVNAKEEAEDIRGLRAIAAKVEDIFRSIPIAERTRNEWGEANAQISLTIDPDRANLAGITNMDVANSSTTSGMSGTTVGALQEGQKQIPIVARLRMDERSQLSDIQNIYVYGSQDNTKIPLVQISNIDHDLITGRIMRLEQFRTINIRSFPIAGQLSSEVLKAAMPRLEAVRGYVAAGLPDPDRRRIRQDKERIQEPGHGDGDFRRSIFLALAVSIQECYQAAAGVGRCALWHDRAHSLRCGSWASRSGSWPFWAWPA